MVYWSVLWNLLAILSTQEITCMVPDSGNLSMTSMTTAV